MHTILCERPVGRWDNYYRFTCQRSKSTLATKALPHVLHLGRALDLGAGSMNDTAFFLDSGFEQVTAVDACPSSADYADKLAKNPGVRPRLQFWNVMFSDFFSFSHEPESCDLVHSNFALPYHGIVGFEELMAAVTETVKIGGIFSGVFFGNEDGWKNTKPNVPLLSRGQVEAFFKGFEMIDFKESRLDGHLFGDENVDPKDRSEKFWHTFTVIGRRTSPVF